MVALNKLLFSSMLVEIVGWPCGKIRGVDATASAVVECHNARLSSTATMPPND